MCQSAQPQCEEQRRRQAAQLTAAHFNFAVSAGHKTCMAKGVGAWLLSDEPRHYSAYEGRVSPAAIGKVRRWLRSAVVPGNGSDDFAAADGAIAPIRRRHTLSRGSSPLAPHIEHVRLWKEGIRQESTVWWVWTLSLPCHMLAWLPCAESLGLVSCVACLASLGLGFRKGVAL
mmetsp:Transcript_39998/g.80173  ORF Transcript_39998/g.80173 Transcript_39998/m.80173 type:complete len:173 (-) Transcript_39998:73-591(-)